MKKIRKGKKMLLTFFMAIIVIIIAVFVIKGIVNKTPGGVEKPEETPQVITLPETTYSNMEVKNVQMEYLKNNNETMVTMEIHNTTENTVSEEKLDAILIGKDENVLGQIQTYIKKLEPGEQYEISVVLKGDLTATTQIKLVKK